MSGDPQNVNIESLVKPVNYSYLRGFGINVIIDIELVEQEASQNVNLLVLYRTDIDKMVGTRAKYPLVSLAVFDLTYGGKNSEGGVSELKLVTTYDSLSFYAKKIIPSPLPTEDYCYVLTPFSIYLIRMEKSRVTEIQTSSAAKAIQDFFLDDPNVPGPSTA